MRTIFSWCWRLFLRPVLFLFSAEAVHEWSMTWFARLTRPRCCRRLLAWFCSVADKRLEMEILNNRFSSPVGLGAGFDKHARWYNSLGALGFGFVEVGTLTPGGQPGNERPRLFRLKKDQAILNRMGFNNRGAEQAAAYLKQHPVEPIHGQNPLLGINIGKSKTTDNEDAVNDYLHCLEILYPYAAYFTVNVSSPNTEGLRDLQDPRSLAGLLNAVIEKNRELSTQAGISPKPILVKIAPDLEPAQLTAIAQLALDLNLAGIIATNTTISREGLLTPEATVKELGAGGVSGKPLTLRSREVVAHLYRETDGTIPIIGVGGIMNGEDAWEMFRAGASLVQVYTGFIYGGPLFVHSILKTLQKKLTVSGKTSLQEIIGEAVHQ